MQVGKLVLWHLGSIGKLWRQKMQVPIKPQNLVDLLTHLKVGGWPDEVVSVTDQPFNEHTIVPLALTLEGIRVLKDAWNSAVSRAMDAGVDVSPFILITHLRQNLVSTFRA